MSINEKEYIKGRGAQINTRNKFLQHTFVQEHIEAIDEDVDLSKKSQYIPVHPKTIINKVDSPDLGMYYSMNPYQGCEHGCLYCYARTTHEYWGYSAGLDFEQKILVKHNTPELLEETLRKKNWEPYPVMLSGNTDCYQPIEKKLEITRRVLQIFLKYKHPVSIITKNALVLRDLDILTELAKMNLVCVSLSITTLDDKLRLLLEPRTTTIVKRLEAVEKLSAAGIPVNVMMAPVIPAINSMEILKLVEKVSSLGARSVGYTIVRLNGEIATVFGDWVQKNFPDRADKVIHQVADCHGGQLNDSRFGTRMRGEGKIAEQIRNMFKIARQKYLKDKFIPELDTSLFVRTNRGQMTMFD